MGIKLIKMDVINNVSIIEQIKKAVREHKTELKIVDENGDEMIINLNQKEIKDIAEIAE